MFAAGKTSGGGAAATVDAQFNYVTMLLHGDGTNGAQNNTFLDSSTNAFTITRNGNTTQGSFSPYGSNWSNNFNGSTGYLAAPSSSAFNVSSNNVTAEAWIYLTAFTTGGSPFISTIWSLDSSGSQNTFAYVYSSGAIAVGINGVNEIASSTGVISLNTWYHTAVVRNGSTTTIYVNGVSVASNTTSVWANTGARPFLVGSTSQSANYYFNGYISNVRFVNGTAVYTTAFTPPTTPLTAITNTSILTCQSNRFVDNSTNNFTITATGTPSVQRFNPFGTATAYDTSVIGGSGYFDGSGDFLGVPFSSNLTMPGDFTAECWVYVTSAPEAYGGILAFSNDSENVGWNILIGGTTTKFHFNVAMTYTDTATSMTLNAWTHLALVRSGSTGKLYINGVADANTVTTSATATCPTNPQIGRYPLISNRNFFGYISNTRVIKGTAVYTSNFTPPTAPVTAITNTQLLLNYTNGAIFDNAMMNDLETVNQAQISTSVVKYGTGSLAFDGTGDNLFAPARQNLSFGTGNFTIECWFNWSSAPSNMAVMSSKNYYTVSSNGNWLIRLTSQTGIAFASYDGQSNESYKEFAVPSMSSSTWYHLAIVRSGTTVTLYFNGTASSSGTLTDSKALTDGGVNGVYVGQGNINNNFNGYIDDVRITNGYARYTADFTPPTAAFPNTGPY